MTEITQKSPFKFLDAYTKDDKDLFFGRDEEVDTLYSMTFDTRLIVFFGASGTGKTSMIQCGLANKFPETRWQELYIRRNTNINESILDELNNALEPFRGNKRIESPIEGLRLLNKYTAKPIFLTFDQFEELFILHPDQEEQKEFFAIMQELLETPISCKTILVMREEFIAHLWDYEYLIPCIFDHRFRIKQLQRVQLKNIFTSTLECLQREGKLVVEDADKVTGAILKKLEGSGSSGIELTYVQVFLDQLYRRVKQEGDVVPVFNEAAVGKMGSIGDMIDDFLDEQLAILEAELGPERKGVPLKILGAMVSDERTKKVLQIEDIDRIQQQYELTDEEMKTCLQAFERMRILNRYES